LITYQVEKWGAIVDELLPLFERHYEEVGQKSLPLDIDYEKYRMMAYAGILHVTTVRYERKLVGYNLTILTGGLHYKSSLQAFNDMHYLLPEYRKGYTWSKLLDFFEKEMVALGVKLTLTGVKAINGKFPKRKILERRGYEASEMLFIKKIGG